MLALTQTHGSLPAHLPWHWSSTGVERSGWGLELTGGAATNGGLEVLVIIISLLYIKFIGQPKQ